MASRRMLPDTVVLSNYVGEVNDVANYQETVISYVYCPLEAGVSADRQGKKAKDSVQLYIFDLASIACSSEGDGRTYLPFEQWDALAVKTGHWTLSDKGRDYFTTAGSTKKQFITSFSRLAIGNKRMWHFEVKGQ